MQQTRHALRRDPGHIVPIIDRWVAALEAGRPDAAITALRGYISAMGSAIMSLQAARGRAAADGGSTR